jgi:hypothetical protein
MGVMDQPVKDRISDGRIADLFMPVLRGELTGGGREKGTGCFFGMRTGGILFWPPLFWS